MEEFGSIERELYIEASPEVVFDVISNPDHVKEWWPDEADYEATPGSSGRIVFGDCNAGGKVAPILIVDAQPPTLFSFRWANPVEEPTREDNSFFVVFELTPKGTGTLLKMTETGFRQAGWSMATSKAHHDDHVAGWDHFLPRIAPCVATLPVES